MLASLGNILKLSIYKLLFSLKNPSSDNGLSRQTSIFFEKGFHGDKYLLQLVDTLVTDCLAFIETGTNVGSTLAYVARTYPHLQCFSCEPDQGAFQEALKNTTGLDNVWLYNETSQQHIERLKAEQPTLFTQKVLFWLDAHGYGFEWPLREEIAFITHHFTRPYILIDDFKVPDLDIFLYDEYQNQVCSFDYIQQSINPDLTYRLYYPAYTDKTSQHHPLRGWGLLEYGDQQPLILPETLVERVRQVE
jgi:hypothetical protein